MKKLSDRELKMLDEELFKFRGIQRTIDLRRLELTTRNPDSQGGPSIGISKPTETIAVKLAHRLSTIQNADQILVLDAGQIIEQGTHDQLMQLDGRYAEMQKIQQKV